MPDPATDPDRVAREFSQAVADRVMAAIIYRGLSVRAVAKASGIDRTTLQDRINNVRTFNTDQLARVALVVRVDPATFFDHL